MHKNGQNPDRRARFPAAILAACFALLSIVPGRPAFAAASAWIDIEIDDGLIFLDAEVQGISGRAFIDTGANINAVNESFIDANELSFKEGRDRQISGVFGTENRTSYLTVPVSLFGADIDFKNLTELSLGSPDVNLLLGAPFLELFVFQFDYPNQRMRIITRDSVDLKKQRNLESRRDPDSGRLMVKVRLNDEDDAWLLMDTGNSGGVLIDRSIARKNKWLERYPRAQSVSVGVNSSGQIERFNLESMKFGPFELANPIVSVPGEGEKLEMFQAQRRQFSRIRSKRKVEGILGFDVLQHFILTVDYKGGHMHVAAGEAE